METQPLDRLDDHTSGETPEDVAILYSWANLEGAKYRDFSANRREYRAQMRHRAAEQLRLMELRAQSEAEAAAVEAEAEAAAAHAEADAATVKLAASRTMQNASRTTITAPEDIEAEEQVEHMRRSSLREAAQQARRAAAERLEAARRAEAAALADSIARREEREIAEAQASALRQAAQYAEAEVRGRQKKTMQPENPVPGRISDPYGPQVVAEGEYFERPGTPVAELEASRFRQQRNYIEQNTGAELPEFRMPEATAESLQPVAREYDDYPEPPQASKRPRGYKPDEPSGVRRAATDESLIGPSSQEMPIGGQGDFEPRRPPKPIYEERHLSIARDAHRLDEAGALQLRREQRRAADIASGNTGPQARVVVPSIPYKEFRRVNGTGSQSSLPEIVSGASEPIPEESGWRAAESLIGTGHSQLRGAEPRQREQPIQRGVPRGTDSDRWGARTSLPVSDSSIRGGNDSTVILGREAEPHAESRTEPGPGATTFEPKHLPSDSGRMRVNGNGSGSGSEPARDSWGVAWKQPDPRVADVRPTWSSRNDSVRPETPRAAAPMAQVPVEASGPAWLYPKAQGLRFVDSLVDSSNRRKAELAAISLKVGSGQTPTQPARNNATGQLVNGQSAGAQTAGSHSAEVQAAGAQERGGAVENTLQHSREQVASRWFALKGVFARADRDQKQEQQAAREKKRNTPFVVVYSLAGGVGKTSLVATLGRSLSSLGEKVLLTDTTSQGLLPFYFGASQLHYGVVRTFSPPTGSTDAPIHLVSYDLSGTEKDPNEAEGHDELFEDLVANSQRAHRVLMDLNANCGWMMARMAWMKPTILVPLAADMNSVISLKSVEQSFSGLLDTDGKALQPVYLLNQFDATLPLHLDVREVLKQQLGDRLLPFVVRRASGVSEALAEGMTIVDYDPESEVARDYMGVANWLRNASAPATVGFRNLRWSER